jgi:hypothetical protein
MKQLNKTILKASIKTLKRVIKQAPKFKENGELCDFLLDNSLSKGLCAFLLAEHEVDVYFTNLFVPYFISMSDIVAPYPKSDNREQTIETLTTRLFVMEDILRKWSK